MIPAPVLAETWGSPGQARSAQQAEAFWVEVLDRALAKAAGELCRQGHRC